VSVAFVMGRRCWVLFRTVRWVPFSLPHIFATSPRSSKQAIVMVSFFESKRPSPLFFPLAIVEAHFLSPPPKHKDGRREMIARWCNLLVSPSPRIVRRHFPTPSCLELSHGLTKRDDYGDRWRWIWFQDSFHHRDVRMAFFNRFGGPKFDRRSL